MKRFFLSLLIALIFTPAGVSAQASLESFFKNEAGEMDRLNYKSFGAINNAATSARGVYKNEKYTMDDDESVVPEAYQPILGLKPSQMVVTSLSQPTLLNQSSSSMTSLMLMATYMTEPAVASGTVQGLDQAYNHKLAKARSLEVILNNFPNTPRGRLSRQALIACIQKNQSGVNAISVCLEDLDGGTGGGYSIKDLHGFDQDYMTLSELIFKPYIDKAGLAAGFGPTLRAAYLDTLKKTWKSMYGDAQLAIDRARLGVADAEYKVILDAETSKEELTKRYERDHYNLIMGMVFISCKLKHLKGSESLDELFNGSGKYTGNSYGLDYWVDLALAEEDDKIDLLLDIGTDLSTADTFDISDTGAWVNYVPSFGTENALQKRDGSFWGSKKISPVYIELSSPGYLLKPNVFRAMEQEIYSDYRYDSPTFCYNLAPHVRAAGPGAILNTYKTAHYDDVTSPDGTSHGYNIVRWAMDYAEISASSKVNRAHMKFMSLVGSADGLIEPIKNIALKYMADAYGTPEEVRNEDIQNAESLTIKTQKVLDDISMTGGRAGKSLVSEVQKSLSASENSGN